MDQILSPLTISGIFTVCLYFITFLSSILTLRSGRQQGGLNLFALSAIAAHAFYLYLIIDGRGPHSLSLFNMLSLTNWLALLVLMVNSLRQNITLILAIISAFAATSTMLGMMYPTGGPNHLQIGPVSLTHIIAAITGTGFLLLAAVQALLVLIADAKLRSHPTHVPSYFPPLQSLERFQFQLLALGFFAMTLAMILAVFWLKDAWTSQPLHKSILSSMAWVVFATLLIGHQWKGWRGAIAAKWTLGGFVLLAIGYFGSKLVVELILA
ncbi:MAG: cytochrome c biogenesis protein CcsA [Gammaproteobacteria bacterium]|nr:cytochrome c biogenesis protein CcsA [Gammaproteobacteria bacterium]